MTAPTLPTLTGVGNLGWLPICQINAGWQVLVMVVAGMSVIVAPQPQAAEIGLEVLRRGGNAVDAAVTCAFAQGVLDPQMCGIGGCGVMLIHDRHGEDVLLEFYSTAGSRVREDMWEPLYLREAADRYGY
ncbi:MAG TPA: gamma-glutamyltransferase, partial [Streptosporangiaceae bacterium]|nr:gamma-glutamyltransferase [Streptosporangiaceae bacterium]